MDASDIHVIIMAGASDFGRCKLASRLSTALWPLDGGTAISHLLRRLADQGVHEVTICASHDNAALAGSFETDNRIHVDFFVEELPAGTAGCIRDAMRDRQESLLVVFPANILCPPTISSLIEVHKEHRAELTVMLNPDGGDTYRKGQISGIYVMNAGVLELAPEAGYADIKEGLIPQMVREGKRVLTATLPHPAGNFRNWQEYLSATADYLEWKSTRIEGTEPCECQNAHTAEVAAGAEVDRTARLCGLVSVLEGARIARGAIVLGPTVIGRGVVVGEDSTVAESVIWDGSRIGRGSHVGQCVLDRGTAVGDRITIAGQAISAAGDTIAGAILQKAAQAVAHMSEVVSTGLQELAQAGHERGQKAAQCVGTLPKTYIAGFTVLAAFLYCCWPNLTELWTTWLRSDEYSSGLLVPFIAAYVLWAKKRELLTFTPRPSLWLGLAAIAAAQALRLYGLFYMYRSAEQLSIVLTVVAAVVMLFGWDFARRISAVLVFLLLMLPWPNRIQTAIAQPLQNLATRSAVFMLEMSGYEVMREGNVINMGQTSVAVAEACNGLRMITAFFVIGGLVALIVKRAWWEKLTVLVSCLPIALLCNTIRLTITSIAFTRLEGEHWEEIFHDFGGYAMMPLALAAIVGELCLLKHLTTAPQRQETLVIERHKG